VLLWGVLGCDAGSMLGANTYVSQPSVFGVTAAL